MNTPTPQLEHDASASRKNCSQVDRVISLLHEHGEGTWVPMPLIARVMSGKEDGGQGNCPPRRIHDAKKRLKPQGFTIENRVIHEEGEQRSYYRLIRLPALSSNPSQL